MTSMAASESPSTKELPNVRPGPVNAKVYT